MFFKSQQVCFELLTSNTVSPKNDVVSSSVLLQKTYSFFDRRCFKIDREGCSSQRYQQVQRYAARKQHSVWGNSVYLRAAHSQGVFQGNKMQYRKGGILVLLLIPKCSEGFCGCSEIHIRAMLSSYGPHVDLRNLLCISLSTEIKRKTHKYCYKERWRIPSH